MVTATSDRGGVKKMKKYRLFQIIFCRKGGEGEGERRKGERRGREGERERERERGKEGGSEKRRERRFTIAHYKIFNEHIEKVFQ